MVQTQIPPPPPPVHDAEAESPTETTGGGKKSVKKPKVLTGLTCASCGGTVGVQEGRTNIECRYCGTPQAVVGERGIARVMVLNRLDRRQAGEVVRGWLRRGWSPFRTSAATERFRASTGQSKRALHHTDAQP